VSDAVRLATPDDLAAIVEIYNAAIPARMSTADLEPVSVEARRPWFESHSPDRRPLFVLDRDGMVAGFVSLTDWHTRAAYGATAQIGVYVAPDFQRRGVASALLAHALAAAPGLGIDRIIGLIFAHNTPSLALFERFGFTRWGLLPGVTVLDGVRRDVVIHGLAT
jgi:phosphinothricin acetyltransferase